MHPGMHLPSLWQGVAGMTATIAPNPLLVQDGLPKFDVLAATDVKPAVTQIVTSLENGFAEFEKSLRDIDKDALDCAPHPL